MKVYLEVETTVLKYMFVNAKSLNHAIKKAFSIFPGASSIKASYTPLIINHNFYPVTIHKGQMKGEVFIDYMPF